MSHYSPPASGPDILPLDVDLPGLQAAWDPTHMRNLFEGVLRPRGGARFDIVDCRLSGFRYRQGTRAIILYALRLRGEVGGPTVEQWITGTIYPGKRAKRRYRRITTEVEQMSLPSSLPFAPVDFVPELNMLVQLFPVDRYLPTLPALAAGPPPELEAKLLETFGPGRWQVKCRNVAPVRYRASFGATLRYTLEAQETVTGRRLSKSFYAKVYRDSGMQTYKLLSSVAQQTASGDFDAVRPLVYLNDLRTVVLHAAPGKSLDLALLDGRPVAEASALVASALASMHQGNLQVDGYRSRDDVMHRVHRATTLIHWACPELGPALRDITAALDARLGEQPRHPAHLDAKPEHIFLDGDRVTLIDLDSCSLGDPVHDPASLVARLQALPHLSSMTEAAARVAAGALVDSYFDRVPTAWRTRLGPAYACAALKVALFFVQHQRAGWRVPTTTFVSRAGRALEREASSPWLL